MTDLSFLVVVLAAMLGASWVGGGVSYPLVASWVRRNPALARGLPALLAWPSLLALVVGVAAWNPGDPHLRLDAGCHCAASMPGWTHLCPYHPEAVTGVAPFAALVLLAWGARRWRRVVALVEQLRWPGLPGTAEVVLPLDRPTARLVGWWRPVLVVDPRLWSALAEPQREAVRAHERGHLLRQDPATLLVLKVLSLFWPSRAAESLVAAWREHAEVQADALAARAVGDPLLVAEALLRCARLDHEPALAPGGIGWMGASLERRVQALLRDQGAPVAQAPDLRWGDGLILLAWLGLALSEADRVHHLLEHLLNFPG